VARRRRRGGYEGDERVGGRGEERDATAAAFKFHAREKRALARSRRDGYALRARL